jgi:hypothetical protein
MMEAARFTSSKLRIFRWQRSILEKAWARRRISLVALRLASHHSEALKLRV